MKYEIIPGQYRVGEFIAVSDIEPGVYALGDVRVHVFEYKRVIFGVVRKAGYVHDGEKLKRIGGIEDVLDDEN